MHLQEINHSRLVWLVKHALPQGAIREIFRTKKKIMMISGLTWRGFDQGPKGDAEALKILQSAPDKLDMQIRSWLLDSMPQGSDMDIGQGGSVLDSVYYLVMRELDLLEDDEGSEQTDKVNERHAITIFKAALSEEEVPTELRRYLGSTRLSSSSASSRNDNPEISIEQVADLIESGVTSKSTEDSSDLDLLFKVLLSRSEENFRDLQSRLGEDHKILKLLSNFENTNRSEVVSTQIVIRNFEIFESIPLPDDKAVDPEEVDVLGTVRRVLDDGLVFLKARALKTGAEFYSMDSNRAAQLLPETGDLVWRPKASRSKVHPGDSLFLKVGMQSRAENHRTRYAVERVSATLTHCMQCPFPIEKEEDFKKWIEHNQEILAEAKSLVLTPDMRVIRVSFIGDSEVDFDESFSVFSPLVLYKIGNDFLSGGLGEEVGRADFSSTETFLKRLVRSNLFKESNLDKTIISRLAEKLSEQPNKLQSKKFQQLISQLGELSKRRELRDLIINEVLNEDTLSSQIQSRIDSLAAEQSSEIENLQLSLDSLNKQKKAALDELNNLKEKSKRAKDHLRGELQKGFSKAIENSEEVLANSIIFDAVMNFRNRPSGQVMSINESDKNHEDSGGRPNTIFSTTLEGVTGESSALTALLRTTPRPLERFFQAVSILSKVGFSFMFEGLGSRLVTRETALKLNSGEKREFFIRPGTVDVPELSRHFFSKNKSFTLLIHSFNIAPLSVYSPDLIDLCISKQLTPDLYEGKTIIFTPDESGVSLDIPSSLLNTLIRIKISDLEISSSSSVDELITEMEVHAGLSAEVLRLFSEMISRLRDIEDEQEKLVVELAYFLILKGCIERST